jgi:hypothetical protein
MAPGKRGPARRRDRHAVIRSIAAASCLGGTTEGVGFNSTPSGAEVHTSNGLGCVTPCTLTINKNEEFIATFEKSGFIPQQVPVARQVVGAGVAATASNIIAGGLIGLGVDAATGAGYEHVPNPVSIVLQPDTPPPAPPPPVAEHKPTKTPKMPKMPKMPTASPRIRQLQRPKKALGPHPCAIKQLSPGRMPVRAVAARRQEKLWTCF